MFYLKVYAKKPSGKLTVRVTLVAVDLNVKFAIICILLLSRKSTIVMIVNYLQKKLLRIL